MSYNQYVAGISRTIRNFRKGELDRELNEEHVKRWIQQFPENEREIILCETYGILRQWYWNKDRIRDFLKKVICELQHSVDLSSVIFLRIQDEGYSQNLLLEMVSEIYRNEYGIECCISENISSGGLGRYVYIDDGLYTGRRARTDLKKWISQAPKNVHLDVFFMIAYSNHYGYTEGIVCKYAEEKGIQVSFHYGELLLNERNDDKKRVDIIWPKSFVCSNSSVAAYRDELVETGKAHYICRGNGIGYPSGIFSTEKNRNVVEYAFLRCGIDILKQVQQTKFYPLGFSLTPCFGFGSFCATDFNISNTCPLVLWWGSIEDEKSIPGNGIPFYLEEVMTNYYKS